MVDRRSNTAQMHMYLLRPFRIEQKGDSVHLPTRKTESLLAYLVLHPGFHSREKLATLFWADASDASARGSLRKALNFIRKHLGDEIILADREQVQLNPDIDLYCDAAEFERQASRFSAVENPDLHEMDFDLYQNELLTDFYEDWIFDEREHYHQLYIKVLLRAVEVLRAQSEYNSAIQYARKLLIRESTNEQAYQHLIFCHIALGDRYGALQQYENCRKVLETELGVQPARETRALYEWITQSRDTRSLAARVTNLPIPISSFVGRGRELAEIKQLLAQAKLVTLTGVGGSGKTRLAIRVSTELIDSFHHGVWWVDLSSLTDETLLPQSVAKCMGLIQLPEQALIESMIAAIQKKEMLLVLDNCEHLVEACAQLVNRLLTECPHLKVLTTSREALRVDGETVYNVPTLQIPQMDNLSIVDLLLEYESVKLFVTRARAIQISFVLDDRTALFVAQICRRLDGIPLAIELAAARINMFSPEQIARQLQESFNLLTTGNRTALPRHQTLRAAIDWSYDLLSPAEQTLFQRLSVFVNGCTLEAVRSICSGESIRSEDVLDLLTQLIKKSLVNTERIQRESRYRMLETMRQYAQEKLDQSGESNALRETHLQYFLRLAETAEPHLRRAEQIEWLERLDAEHENLRAALAWAMDKQEAQPVLRLTGSLGTFWALREYWLESAKWLDQALSKGWDEKNQSEKGLRARALYRRADFALFLDELDLMKVSAESALKLCQEVEDSWGIAYSRAMVADHLYVTGNPRASKPLFEQSLDEFHRLGDPWGESWVAGLLVGTLMQVGETKEEYRKMRRRAIACARLAGDRDRLAFSLLGYANNLMADRQWDQAETVVQEAQQLLTEIDSSYGMNVTHSFYACIFFASGNYEKAKTEAQLDLEYGSRHGVKHNQAFSFLFLGLIAEIEHDLQRAIEYGQKGLDLFREVGIERDIALCLSILGRLEYQESNREISLQFLRESLTISEKDNMEGYWTPTIFCQIAGTLIETKPEITVKLLGFTEVLWKKESLTREAIYDEPYFNRFLSAARAKLPEEEFAAAWDAGSQMKAEDALDLAWKKLEEL